MQALLPSAAHCSLFSSSSSSSSSLRKLLGRQSSCCRTPRTLCCSTERDPQPVRANHAGVKLEESVSGSEKIRIDSWISSRMRGVSRARIQSSIRSGLVAVNGRTVDKVSHVIKGGDKVSCTVCELHPLRAVPEDIPLDIVYEDAHVLVVNKPSDMVVHPAPGNPNGTLVNAILHHCRLPTVACTINSRRSSKTEGCTSDDEIDDFYGDGYLVEESKSENTEALVRPGIVHRLDKGTSGLLVVAKDEHSHAHLAEQFKQHTIHRVYISITSGVPSPSSGRIEIPIARDPNNRIRMIAASGLNSSRDARYAASRYKVLEVFAGGGSALVRWRLETGRTHQIRAHSKYLGTPLLGDEVYGGTKNLALSLLKPRISSSNHSQLSCMISKLQRPCLHALSLRFKHPHTGEYLQFSCPPPHDFSEVWSQLRSVSDPTSNNEMEDEM
ncbi:RNA pseudouridine synthase 2, chloroplastic [Iris pallida]|uniref:RNA pseudouridine synthase 2, chloroplastic n=1 Tax=Iris pallida TaxID=29817 RepID=A0AAX6HB44_IRIPA|nr:RNA pseudouridine synthase 2, chloroplastic [Iris pallida]